MNRDDLLARMIDHRHRARREMELLDEAIAILRGGAQEREADQSSALRGGDAEAEWEQAARIAWQQENEGRSERGLCAISFVEFLPHYREVLAGIARPDGITQDHDGPECAVKP